MQVHADRPDRFRFFALLPLSAVDKAVIDLGQSLDELNAAGVVAEAHTGGRSLSGPAFESVFAEFGRRTAVLFVLPASPPRGRANTAPGFSRPMLEFLIDTTRALTAFIMNGTLPRRRHIWTTVSRCGPFLPGCPIG